MICFKRHKITTMGRDFGQAPLFILNFLIFLSVSSDSIYILFLMKPKIEIDEMYYFCWFLLISGVVNIIVANNMPLVTNNEHAEILKSGGTQLIVYSFKIGRASCRERV